MSEDIEGEDSSVVFPGIRVTWNIFKQKTDRKGLFDTHPEKDSGEEKGPGRSVWSLLAELELAYGGGSSSQTLGAGQFIGYGGKSISGPGVVDADYDVFHTGLAGRGGWWPSDKFGVEALLGISAVNLDLDVKSGGLSGGDSEFTIGPMIGFQLAFRPVSQLELYSRFGVSRANPNDNDPLVHKKFELGVAILAYEGISVFLGWRSWDLDYRISDSTEPDIKLDLSGPMFGIGYDF